MSKQQSPMSEDGRWKLPLPPPPTSTHATYAVGRCMPPTPPPPGTHGAHAVGGILLVVLGTRSPSLWTLSTPQHPTTAAASINRQHHRFLCCTSQIVTPPSTYLPSQEARSVSWLQAGSVYLSSSVPSGSLSVLRLILEQRRQRRRQRRHRCKSGTGCSIVITTTRTNCEMAEKGRVRGYLNLLLQNPSPQFIILYPPRVPLRARRDLRRTAKAASLGLEVSDTWVARDTQARSRCLGCLYCSPRSMENIVFW